MIVLAVDTTLSACSAAVLDTGGGEERVVERSKSMARGHAEALMPLVGDLLAETGLALHQIDRFAVTVGPGTFTGVRIGVASARGFALATGRSAVGVSTLAALAETARMAGLGEGPLLVAIDARRGEVYAQCFDASGWPLSEPAVAPLAGVISTLPPQVASVFGSAGTLCAEAAAEQERRLEVAGIAGAPRPGAVARLALAVDTAAPPAPLYLRPPDARPQGSAAIARR